MGQTRAISVVSLCVLVFGVLGVGRSSDAQVKNFFEGRCPCCSKKFDDTLSREFNEHTDRCCKTTAPTKSDECDRALAAIQAAASEKSWLKSTAESARTAYNEGRCIYVKTLARIHADWKDDAQVEFETWLKEEERKSDAMRQESARQYKVQQEEWSRRFKVQREEWDRESKARQEEADRQSNAEQEERHWQWKKWREGSGAGTQGMLDREKAKQDREIAAIRAQQNDQTAQNAVDRMVRDANKYVREFPPPWSLPSRGHAGLGEGPTGKPPKSANERTVDDVRGILDRSPRTADSAPTLVKPMGVWNPSPSDLGHEGLGDGPTGKPPKSINQRTIDDAHDILDYAPRAAEPAPPTSTNHEAIESAQRSAERAAQAAEAERAAQTAEARERFASIVGPLQKSFQKTGSFAGDGPPGGGTSPAGSAADDFDNKHPAVGSAADVFDSPHDRGALPSEHPTASNQSGIRVAYDPGTGAMSVGPSSLKPGDVIVIGTTFSAAAPYDTGKDVGIQTALSQPVAHAMIVESVPTGGRPVTVIEAIGSGVQRTLLDESLSQMTQGVVFRDPSLSDAQRDAMVKFAAGRIGTPYDYKGAAGLITGGGGDKEKMLCSDLVVQAYQQVGGFSGVDSKHFSPGDLVESGRLKYAGHLMAGSRYVRPQSGQGVPGASAADEFDSPKR